MSFGAGHWPYLLILLVVVLIIWGPSKLPDLGSGMGRAIREFRKASTETKESFTGTPPSSPPPAAGAVAVAAVPTSENKVPSV